MWWLMALVGSTALAGEWDWRKLEDMVDATHDGLKATRDRYSGSWQDGILELRNDDCQVRIPFTEALEVDFSSREKKDGHKHWVEYRYPDTDSTPILRVCGGKTEELDHLVVGMRQADRTRRLYWASGHLRNRWVGQLATVEREARSAYLRGYGTAYQAVFDEMKQGWPGGKASDKTQFPASASSILELDTARRVGVFTVTRGSDEPATVKTDWWQAWEDSRGKIPGYKIPRPAEELSFMWGYYPVYEIVGLRDGALVGFVRPNGDDVAFEVVDYGEGTVGPPLLAAIKAMAAGRPADPASLWFPGSVEPAFAEEGGVRVLGYRLDTHAIALWELLTSMARRKILDRDGVTLVSTTRHDSFVNNTDLLTQEYRVGDQTVVVRLDLFTADNTAGIYVFAGDHDRVTSLASEAKANRTKPAREIATERVTKAGSVIADSLPKGAVTTFEGFLSTDEGWEDVTVRDIPAKIRATDLDSVVLRREIELRAGVYTMLLVSDGSEPALHMDGPWQVPIPGLSAGELEVVPVATRIERDGKHRIYVRVGTSALQHLRIIRVGELDEE